MASAIVGSAWSWSGKRDSEGHRTYFVEWLIKSGVNDGPFVVMNTPGLPVPGTWWVLGADSDLWAWCLPDMEITPQKTGEPNEYWKVKQTFTTKPPPPDQQRPFDPAGGSTYSPKENPLLEPPKVSGSFIKKKEEAQRDRFNLPITTTSHEQIRGPQNEWDSDEGDSIIIEQNVADLELGMLSLMKNWVNDAPLWGLNARCVKLSDYSWDKKYFGYSFYYTRRLTFEANPRGFDRSLLDEGTKVLRGHWDIRGTGATVTITVTAGVISGVTLAAGGAGYAKSATINLTVSGGGGTGGVIAVTTSAAGVVTAFSSIVSGGSGYANTSGAATQPESGGWILDNINGRQPDYTNPTHFIRYTDPLGNLSRVVLDSKLFGQPYDPDKNCSFTDGGGIVPGSATPPGSDTSGIGPPSTLTSEILVGGSLPSGFTYKYVVTSLTPSGESNASAEVTATTTWPDLGTEGTVRIHWAPVVGARGYKVYRKIGSDPSYLLMGNNGAGSSPGVRFTQKYPQGNLLLLGIPTTL